MNQYIQASLVNGKLQAPASKSVVQRVLAAALLSNGKSLINGYTACDDSVAATEIIKNLGAVVSGNGREVKVSGCAPVSQLAMSKTIHCGESGLSSRLFAPIALLFANDIELVGEGSLLQRPFTALQQPFAQLGVQCLTDNGFVPLRLKGQLKPTHIKLDGSGGSQFLSGLLMALPLLNGDSVIEVDNLKSKPYIDLTIEVLKEFSVNIEHHNYQKFEIKGHQQYIATNYTIEGDWSGASCILVAGAVAGSVELAGLKAASAQADKAIVDVLISAGAAVTVKNDVITVSKNKLQAFEFDATHCPDLFPALVVLAANCMGISRIAGVNRLINKESNRALTLQTEMANVGVIVEFDDDIMLVHGGQIKGGQTSAHNDHRIAMAMGVAGLTAQMPVSISGAECVNKSYPAFFEDLKSIVK